MRAWGFIFIVLFHFQVVAADRDEGPRTQVFSHSRTVTYGRPFSGGGSPDESVRRAIQENLDLRLKRASRLKRGEKLGLTYDLYLNGRIVEGAFVKAILENRPPYPIHLLQSELPREIRVSKGRKEFVAPKGAELLYLLDSSSGEAALVYKVIESGGTPEDPIRKAHYFEEGTGKLLRTENLVYFHLAEGVTSANLTPNLRPPSSTNPGPLLAMPQALVEVLNPAGISPIQSDGVGTFSFELDSSSAQIRASLQNPWVRVLHQPSQSILSITKTMNLPNFFEMKLGSSGDVTKEAQSNIFYHTIRLHDWIRNLAPDLEEIDMQILAYANLNAACNAYYVNNSINFFNSSSGCPNTAYSTVIAHEYGHFVVERLGLRQGSFGEGYSDLLAMLFFNTPSVGEGFFNYDANPLRSPGMNRISYPCGSGSHHCGQTLAGSFWQIRQNLVNSQGAEGVELLNQLFADWSQVTGGGLSNDSAHPLTAIEILSVDDDDGNFENGSPHWDSICRGFESRGIYCPPLDFYDVQLNPASLEILRPQRPQSISLHLSPRLAQNRPLAVRMKVRQEGGQWIEHLMQATANWSYRAVMPLINCGDRLEYYFEIEVSPERIQRFPSAPQNYEVYGATESSLVAQYSFGEYGDEGWHVENDSVSSGPWQRALANPQIFPVSDYDGSNIFWMTGHDGDWHMGGLTTLFSPEFDIQSDYVVVSYARATTNYWEENANILETAVNVNDLGWSSLETVTNSSNGWELKNFRVNNQRYSKFQFRFSHFNNYENYGTAVVDHFSVRAMNCSPALTYSSVRMVCVADFDRDGDVDQEDLIKFMQAYMEQDPSSDLNRDGKIDSLDYELFLRSYSEGC